MKNVLSYCLLPNVDLGIHYIDVFFWGWIDEQNASSVEKYIGASDDIRRANRICERQIERMFGVSEKLKKMGAVRYIGASFQKRFRLKKLCKSSPQTMQKSWHICVILLKLSKLPILPNLKH